MRDADALLSNDDIGRDLQGVRFLLKKHQVDVLFYLYYKRTVLLFRC